MRLADRTAAVEVGTEKNNENGDNTLAVTTVNTVEHMVHRNGTTL